MKLMSFFDLVIVVSICIVCVNLINFFDRPKVQRKSFTDAQAIRAIIGEYGKADLDGMGMIAHAIRNRGTLRGVYGLNAKHVDHEPKAIWKLATIAWEKSKTSPDPVFGADSWYSISDYSKYGTPYGMKLMLFSKGFYFFKTNKTPNRVERVSK